MTGPVQEQSSGPDSQSNTDQIDNGDSSDFILTPEKMQAAMEESLKRMYGDNIPGREVKPKVLNPTLDNVNKMLNDMFPRHVELHVDECPPIVCTSPGYIYSINYTPSQDFSVQYLGDSAPSVDGEKVSAYAPSMKLLVVRGTQNALEAFELNDSGSFDPLILEEGRVLSVLYNMRSDLKSVPASELVTAITFSSDEKHIILRLSDGTITAIGSESFQPSDLEVRYLDSSQQECTVNNAKIFQVTIEGADPVLFTYSPYEGLKILKAEASALDNNELISKIKQALKDNTSLAEKIVPQLQAERIFNSYVESSDGRWLAIGTTPVIEDKSLEWKAEMTEEEIMAFDAALFSPNRGTGRNSKGFLFDKFNSCCYELAAAKVVLLTGNEQFLCTIPEYVDSDSISAGDKKAKLIQLSDQPVSIDLRFLGAPARIQVRMLTDNKTPLVISENIHTAYKATSGYVSRCLVTELPNEDHFKKKLEEIKLLESGS